MKSKSCALSIRLILVLSSAVIFSASAWSQCNNPSSPGVVICNPTMNATVAYGNLPPEISVRSTPAQGATITSMILYDNNNNFYQNTTGGINLYDGSIYNGKHNIVANVWDSDGNLYQAKTTFNVEGLGFPPCTQPSKPSVVICNPPAGSIYPTDAVVEVAATGKGSITKLQFYLNGKLVQTVTNSYTAGVPIQLTGQGVNNTVKVVATDSSGNRYLATKVLNAAYTYGLGFCDQQCITGINPVAPNDEAYVANRFNINMQVINNPNPITTMKAYLDNNVVAESSNATLQAEVTGTDGTHVLTVQAWDDKGIEYRIQQDVNINVHE
jgi:Bacterial Ig domain